MPLLSVITAAYGPSARYLAEARDGVLSQALPPGWELEWIVQEDGDSPTLCDQLSDARITYAANRTHLGVAMTRNLALSHARGALIQVLDHDDVLLPGAHETLIPLFDEPMIQWATGRADDLHVDGSRRPYASSFPHGVIPAGHVNQWARDHDGNWPIHCANLMMRTSTVRALGGWVASPTDDDIALLSALTEMADGYNASNRTWLYRIHPDQAHRSDAWKQRSADGRRIALLRATAVAATGLTVTVGSRDSDVPSIEQVRIGPPVKD
ncbi:MAG: glycosyltransferase family 2 protein [Nocardioides sp.]